MRIRHLWVILHMLPGPMYCRFFQLVCLLSPTLNHENRLWEFLQSCFADGAVLVHRMLMGYDWTSSVPATRQVTLTHLQAGISRS